MTFKTPKRAIIETEYTCNLNCKMCSLWQNNYIKKRDEEKIITAKDLDIVYKKLSDFGIERITYIGGEPFLKNYLIETSINSRKYNLIPSVVTNGTLLDDYKINQIIENQIFENIIFSIDGPPKIHNEIRGKDIFEKVYNNIKKLSILKTKNKLKKPRILIYITVWDKNYKTLEKTINLIRSLNPNKIRIQLASNITESIINETNKKFQNSIITHSYINSIKTDEAFKFIKEKQALLTQKYRNLEFEKIFYNQNKICHFISNDLIITPKGNILICPMLNNLSIGNIYKDDLKEVYFKNIEKINEIKLISETKKLPICTECCVEKIR
jgi:sulfatase maturation enzyme AslB (radical SAM superfamily)